MSFGWICFVLFWGGLRVVAVAMFVWFRVCCWWCFFKNLLLRPERLFIFLTPSQAKYCQQIPSSAAEYSMPASWGTRYFTTAQPLLAVLARSHPPSLLLIQQGPPFQKLPTLDPHHGPPPPQEGRAQVTTGFISGGKHEETVQRPETSTLTLPSCQDIKRRVGEALRKAVSLLPRGEVAEECNENVSAWKPCRNEFAGPEAKVHWLCLWS